MKTQARIIKKRENDIHGYDRRLNQVYRLLEKDLSDENFKLIKRYDQMFVQQSLTKAYRCRNLNALLVLTRMLDKNWMDGNKEDFTHHIANATRQFVTFREYYVTHTKLMKQFPDADPGDFL